MSCWLYREKPFAKGFEVGYRRTDFSGFVRTEICDTREEAARRVHYLNGGTDETKLIPLIEEICNKIYNGGLKNEHGKQKTKTD